MAVRLVEGIGDLDGMAQRLSEGQRPLLQPLLERLPLDVLHDQVQGAVLVADVVKGADVRMVQARDGLGLALEALAHVRVARRSRLQHLDRDRAGEAGVARQVDLAHPPAPRGRSIS